MDKHLAIVSSLFMLNYASSSYECGYTDMYRTANKGTIMERNLRYDYKWNYQTHILSPEEPYGDFLGSERRPVDFSMSELLENLNLDPTILL